MTEVEKGLAEAKKLRGAMEQKKKESITKPKSLHLERRDFYLPEQPIEPIEITEVDLYKNEEKDEVVLYQSNTPNIDKIQAHLIEQIKDVGKTLPEKMKITARDNAYENGLWTYIKSIPVPDDIIKKREGSDKKMYDYFPEFYTTAELDRLFPGWWYQDMQTRYDEKSMAYITTGYICIEYVLPSGIKKIRPIYASGGADVFPKKGTTLPSQPADRAAASVTKFIKLAGKRLGIGLEIYHNQILPARREQFAVLIGDWGTYSKEIIEIYKSCKTGSGVRKLCRILPTPDQTIRLKLLVNKLPDKVKDAIWKNFIKLHRDNANAWLTDWEQKITKKEEEKATEKKKTEFEYE